MALYEKKWWKRIFSKKKVDQPIDTLKDVEAIRDFLLNINLDSKTILELLEQLDELQREEQVAKEGIIQLNLEAQSQVLDKLLERYEFFQNDVDINGLRVKIIAKELLAKMEKAGLKDLIKMKKDDWKF